MGLMWKRFFLKERNMLAAISLNAIIIFLMYFPQFEESSYLLLIDHFFLILF